MGRPILFSSPMVQASLAGTKTQTRRLKGLNDINVSPDDWVYLGNDDLNPKRKWGALFQNKNTDEKIWIPFPYQKEDILWVRETWMKPPEITYKMLKEGADTWSKYEYVSDLSDLEIDQFKEWGWKKMPSIFMPHEASRIKLLVKDIRVERLQDISEEDAIAEGMNLRYEKDGDGLVMYDNRNKEAYEELWDSIYGNGSWDRNPWVWVIMFEKI